jgi:hypothetical protein
MEAADMANYGELSMLEQARGPQGDTRGAGMLGYVLGGGARAHAQQIGMQGAITGARMQEILAEARRVQQAEINRQSLQHRYYSEGKNALAEMIGTMKEVNPNLIADYNQKEQKTGYSQQAWQTAHGEHPDLNTLNRELMVIDGKPQQLTKIEDNTVLNPMTTPDTQNLQTTELGRAIIGAKGAEANSANTAATLHNAEAESARALTENRKAELPTIGANKVRKFSEPEMSAALGGPPDDKGKAAHRPAAPGRVPRDAVEDAARERRRRVQRHEAGGDGAEHAGRQHAIAGYGVDAQGRASSTNGRRRLH